jgi:GPH family glycoside/pentoside/hexuronide:cation symporter
MTAMNWMVLIYLLKFSTETLGLAPALVGSLFAVGRIWDGVSDPVAGWLSDRTRTRIGRRRPWMFAAALPLALSYYALWSPPAGLDGALPAIWLGGFLLLFYSTSTCFSIPHASLGAELSPQHHERTRISANRVAAEVLGIAMALMALYLLESNPAQREVARSVALGIAALTALGIAIAAFSLREPPGHQRQSAENPFRAFADVARNPHALRVTIAMIFAEVGLGSLLVIDVQYMPART